jgi:3-oxoacyl-[acyl-carrier protein] reductase
VVVQHDWQGGPLERGTPGFELKEAVAGEPDLHIVKTVHSSFHGDVDLDAWLRERGIGAIAVCGIQTNVCCETTARIGSDLGYDVWFVLDATHTFDLTAPDGGGAGCRDRAHDGRQPPGRVRGGRDDRRSLPAAVTAETVMEPIWNDGRRFAGRVALVTGAGGTLGGAVATGFGREGAAVVLGYRSSQSAAEAVAAQIVSAGGAAYPDRLDVTDQDSVDGFVARADETYGRVDVLVNAAGRLDQADTVRFEAMTPEAATELLMVDVVGTMRMSHAVIPLMRRHGRGVIVNFSSTYGNGVSADNPINWVPVTYCAAKGAIRGFTAALARDVAPEIRVNALAPGPISGNWEQEWGVAPEHIEEAKAMNPMKRFGDPREVAETVLFLASDGAGYINGQVLHVEGGWIPAG